jgi:predicted RNase H-like HicB family nuclease
MMTQAMNPVMNHKYTMVIQWSEEDRLYLVHLPEFPWQEFVTHGSTYEEAAKNGQEALEGLITVLQDNHQPLPEPQFITLAKVARSPKQLFQFQGISEIPTDV